MLCKVSTLFGDVRCPVCGQEFLVYWTRQRAGEREEQRGTLQQALREQHGGATSTSEAHLPAFEVPEQRAALPYHRPRSAAQVGVPVYS